MLNKLNIFLGLADDQSDLEATKEDKAAIYSMYSIVSLVKILILILSF